MFLRGFFWTEKLLNMVREGSFLGVFFWKFGFFSVIFGIDWPPDQFLALLFVDDFWGFF